jgi:hypothetical protein
MLQHLPAMISMDWPTLAVIFVLCGFAAYFLKEYLANPPMIVFVYPVLVALSILFQYFVILLEIYPPSKLDQWLMWTIMASICGNITGVALVAAVAGLRDGFDRKRTRPNVRAPSA